MQEERMQKVTSVVIGEVVMCLLYSEGAHCATKYLDENTVVRATRPMTHEVRRRGKVVAPAKLNGSYKRDKRVNVVVTIGEPNYAAREFIKKCKAAGEPFPVKKIQLNMVPGR